MLSLYICVLVNISRWCNWQHLSPFHYPIKTSSPLFLSTASWMGRALSIMIHKKSYPLYIHCLDGRRVSGMLVILFRKLQKKCCQTSYVEYWIYQIGAFYFILVPNFLFLLVSNSYGNADNFFTLLLHNSSMQLFQRIIAW